MELNEKYITYGNLAVFGDGVKKAYSKAIEEKIAAAVELLKKGNVASADKATNDSDGNKISSTYVKKSDCCTEAEIKLLFAEDNINI